MTCEIVGIGTAVPAHRITQADAAELTKGFCCQTAEHERLLPVLYRRSGVGSRHSVLLDCSQGSLAERQSFYWNAADNDDRGPATSQRMQKYEAASTPLAHRACEIALQEAGVDPNRITHLVTVSCSGFSAPGVDVALIDSLNLRADVSRTHVGFMGCHGAINGLRLLRSFVAAEPDACVLLCAVELCSLHQQYGWEPEQVVANSLFADGAAALIAADSGKSQTSAWKVAANGSTIISNSTDAMTWRIGDHGFEMTLSARVPDLISRHVRPWLESWLAQNQLDIASVGSWAVHPGGPKILSAFAESAGLPREALSVSQRILAEFGNMSSPTVLFIIDQFRRIDAPRPCVALGFGPGLAVEAALIR